MKSLSPNTKIDFRKLLAIKFTDYRTVRDSVAALSKQGPKCFLGRFVARLLLAKI